MTFLLVLCSSNVIRIQIGNPDFRILGSGSIIGPVKKKTFFSYDIQQNVKTLLTFGLVLVSWERLDHKTSCSRAGRGRSTPGSAASPVPVCMDQGTIETQNPKCRLYWCLIEFIDWRYSQSCWYFRPLLCTVATLPSL
jgi:hypothetical protein